MGRPLDEDIIIKILERWQKAFKENSHYVSASDLSLVIKDVRELPTIQSVATDINVGDTISRQWLMECVNEGWIKFDTEKDENRFIHLVRDMAPSAQPERKTGKWMPDNRVGGGFWVCSCCKFPSEAFAADVLYKFCPHCGADMKGEQDGH